MKAYTKFLFDEDFKPLFKAVILEECQSFTIGEGDKDHCDFLVRMFNVALEKHDQGTTYEFKYALGNIRKYARMINQQILGHDLQNQYPLLRRCADELLASAESVSGRPSVSKTEDGGSIPPSVAIPVADPTLGSMQLLSNQDTTREAAIGGTQNRPINSLKADGTPRTTYGQSVTSLDTPTDTPKERVDTWKYKAMCRCKRCANFRKQRNADAKEKLGETLEQQKCENYWPYGFWRN